ncbi:MAG: hypothetical protein OEV93_05010 [Candidatus Moranbacteria bacterium]|nr:hypothetical protein [Candidatus Moranbacteria bacterium]
MKQKIFWILTLLLIVFTLSGCNGKEEGRETINPLSPGSMVETLDRSKGKIEKAVEVQDESTTRMLEESGMNE